jgi:TolB-like protein/Flp pilus assembly protein TadD
MGDGFLAEFPSVVNAVACAVAIQQTMAIRNTDVPEGRAVLFRIGVNLGDIVVEDEDVLGDGVNIAVRIEGLAPPGGVAVSAMVHDNVGSRLDLSFEDMGEQQLKNIARPIRVYRLATGAPLSKQVAPLERPKPSVAVLPFTNMSGDTDQEYFSDGITEDIITELSRFRGLSVIARNSSFLYRGKAVDVRRVGQELGAGYILEGSVRKHGDRLRVTAQLIEAARGNHLWSERYDRALADLFDLQDELTRSIVAVIFRRIEEAEVEFATARKTTNLAAHDLLLRGISHIRGYGTDDNRIAREHFERAAQLDPSYGLAHAYLALSLLVEHGYAAAPPEIKARAIEIATRAVRLDPRESRCEVFLGQVYRFSGQFDLAMEHVRKGVSMNPNDASNLAQLGLHLAMEGQADEGIHLIENSIQLDPFPPLVVWGAYSTALFLAGRYQEALDASMRIGSEKRPRQLARDAACLAMLGRIDEAKNVAEEVLRQQPDFYISSYLPNYRRVADIQRIRQAMLMAGLPE